MQEVFMQEVFMQEVFMQDQEPGDDGGEVIYC